MRAKNEGHELSNAGEDYLEAIYCVLLEHPGDNAVRSVDVSERLGVSKASVNKALSALKEGGFVEQTRYGRVELTEEGREYAARVWRRHRMLRSFLSHELGVEKDVADEEACLMEHALSEDTTRRLMDYLERQGVAIDSE